MAILSRWRKYESPANLRALCVLAIYDLLKHKEAFETEEDLIFFLFGNQYRKNRVYWHVEGQLKDDAGIKSFDGPKLVELDSFHDFTLKKEGEDRTRTMRKLETIFSRTDILTWQEKVVLALSFNLSVMEEEREEKDLEIWTMEELSIALQLRETEVKAIRKRALNKLKPHLR